MSTYFFVKNICCIIMILFLQWNCRKRSCGPAGWPETGGQPIGTTKKELLAKKRQKELHRILLPDAPPRKRRTQYVNHSLYLYNAVNCVFFHKNWCDYTFIIYYRRQSPEREACEMAPSTSAEAAQRSNSPLPSTSRSEVEAPVDSPPLIVVPSAPPAVVEFGKCHIRCHYL